MEIRSPYCITRLIWVGNGNWKATSKAGKVEKCSLYNLKKAFLLQSCCHIRYIADGIHNIVIVWHVCVLILLRCEASLMNVYRREKRIELFVDTRTQQKQQQQHKNEGGSSYGTFGSSGGSGSSPIGSLVVFLLLIYECLLQVVWDIVNAIEIRLEK